MSTVQTVEPTDKLTFRYIAAYLVEGLQNPAEGPLLLFSDAEEGKKVSLSGHSHEALNHIVSVHTIANTILNATFQGKAFDPSQFETYRTETQQDRIRRYGADAAFLVVETCHEEEAERIGQIGESDERDHCLAIANGFIDEVRKRHKTFVDTSKAFLSCAFPAVTGLEPVGECIVADHPSGKPLYVLTPSINARITVANPILETGCEQTTRLFEYSTELAEFGTVFQLLAGSLSNTRDSLRAFLFAFIALEVLVSKLFTIDKQRLLAYRRENLPVMVQTYVAAIEQRMQERGRAEDDYPLAYKFALVVAFLGLSNLGEVISEFDEAKRSRDNIAHGNQFDEATLPTAKVRNWLGELVRLNVEREDQGQPNSEINLQRRVASPSNTSD